MRLGSDGRLWPERPIEHLLFWPLLAIGGVGVYWFGQFVGWLVDPYAKMFGAWFAGLF